MEILQFRGDTSPFLNNGPGVPSANLFKMAREGLAADLHAVIQSAQTTGQVAQKLGSRIKHNGKLKEISIEVTPLKSPVSQRCFLILFAICYIVAGTQQQTINDNTKQILKLAQKIARTQKFQTK